MGVGSLVICMRKNIVSFFKWMIISSSLSSRVLWERHPAGLSLFYFFLFLFFFYSLSLFLLLLLLLFLFLISSVVSISFAIFSFSFFHSSFFFSAPFSPFPLPCSLPILLFLPLSSAPSHSSLSLLFFH